MKVTTARWQWRRISTALFFSVLFPWSVQAEIVNLRTGTPIVGKVVAARADGMTFETHAGNVYEIAWDQVFDGDVVRIKKEWGLIVEAVTEPLLIPGRLVRLQDGTEYRGVVVREDERFVQLKMRNNRTPIPKDRILSQEDVAVDALEVYRPNELVELRRKETSPTTPAEIYDLGVFAQKIGAYREAQGLLQSVSEADPGFEAEAVQSQLTKLEVLIANQDLLDQMERIQGLHRSGLFARALTDLRDLRQKQPESPLLGDLSRRGITEEKLEDQIHRLSVLRVANAFFPLMKELVNKIARNRELTLAEARTYVAKQLDDEILAGLAARLTLEPEAIKELFMKRGGGTKYVGDYGSGTYVVYKKKKKQATRSPQRPSSNRRRGGQQQRTRTRKIQKRPPEEWWAQIDLTARRRWLTAYYGDKSKLVTRIREEFDKCSRCGGQGYRIIYASGAGSNTRSLCDRCFGIGIDKKVIFK